MWRYRNLTTQTAVFISPAPVDLIAVVVNTAAASAVVTIYDGTNASAPAIATIDASATGNFFYNCVCNNGLTAVTSGGSANVTVIYDGYYDGPQGENP